MNSLKKRLISLVLLTGMALSAFAGCAKDSGSSKKDSSDSSREVQDNTSFNASEYTSSASDNTSNASDNTSEEASDKKTTAPQIIDSPIEFVTDEQGTPITIPVQSAEIGANSGISNGNGINLGGEDLEKIDVSPKIPSGGQSTTQSVEVTDARGETVTDNSGNPMTEYVTKSGDGSDYKSVTNGNYVLWMDISKDENFVFNDEFIKISFEIKNDIPDGEYPINFATDFSSINGVIHDPVIYPGTITVGGEAKKGEDHSGKTDFILYGDNISCKQGDKVDYYINIKNNPGLAGTVLWFYYDSNAMTVSSKGGVKAAGEFADISNGIQTSR